MGEVGGQRELRVATAQLLVVPQRGGHGLAGQAHLQAVQAVQTMQAVHGGTCDMGKRLACDGIPLEILSVRLCLFREAAD